MHRLELVVCAAALCMVTSTATAGQGVETAPARAVAARVALPSVLPGTHTSVFTTIQGNALNATNGALPNAPVRLRDARYGRIVASQVTDSSGLFAFNSIDPGTYVVELVAKDQSVLAASQLVTVGAGDTMSAIVKLPFRGAPFAGLLGHTVQQAAAIAAAAAASGVLATNVTGVDSSAR